MKKKDEAYRTVEELKEICSKLTPEVHKEMLRLNEYNGSEDVYDYFGILKSSKLKNFQLFKATYAMANAYMKFEPLFFLYERAKIFEIPEKITPLLSNTINKIRKVRSAYGLMFLDVSLVNYDRVYYGFFIMDKDLMKKLYPDKKIAAEGIVITTTYFEDKGLKWEIFDFYEKDKNKYQTEIKNFIMNFTDFVNSDDVRLTFVEKTKNNIKRRKKQGKIPIPSHYTIYVVGYLKKYFSQLEKEKDKFGSSWQSYSHRFWIRGHFRHFWHKKYKRLYELYKKGKLKKIEGQQYIMDEEGTLKLWILPYIKGHGILIDSQYKLR